MTKNKKPVRGRPELPEKEKRSVLMQFRVTECEKRKIDRICLKQKISITEFLRREVLGD